MLLRYLVVTGVVVLQIISCTHSFQGTVMTDQIYPNSFNSPFDVRPGYRAKSTFSPELDENFVGIRIDAPKLATFNVGDSIDRFESFTNIPVSMAFRFSAAYEIKFDNISDHMAVVAVNSITGKSFSSTLQDEDPVIYTPTDFSKIAKEKLENTFNTGYLTFNVAQFLKIPQENATYDIHVTLEEYQSNVVTVTLQEK